MLIFALTRFLTGLGDRSCFFVGRDLERERCRPDRPREREELGELDLDDLEGDLDEEGEARRRRLTKMPSML